MPYQEEEDERSDKWRSFIEQVAKSSQASSSENKHKETLKAESNEVKEEGSPHRVSNSGDLSSPIFSEGAEVDETNADRISKGNDSSGRNSAEGNEIIEGTILNRVNKEGDSSSRTSSGETDIKEGTGLGRSSEGDDSSSKKSFSDCSTTNNSAKELHHSDERKTCKVQHWAEIRPSLSAIGEILSSRVKKGKNMKGEKIHGSDDHLPSIEELEPVEGTSEEDIQGEVCTNETLDGGNGSRAENDLMDQNFPELYSPWKELESLVQGGVPKDLRGEVKFMLSISLKFPLLLGKKYSSLPYNTILLLQVWQAFVGVNTRRVESYYDDLLAQENNNSEGKEVTSVASGKWRKQIEKVISCTRLGIYFDL